MHMLTNKSKTSKGLVLAGFSLSLCHFKNDQQVQHNNTNRHQLAFSPKLYLTYSLFVFQSEFIQIYFGLTG